MVDLTTSLSSNNVLFKNDLKWLWFYTRILGYCFGVYLECACARRLQLVAVFFWITLLHECGQALGTVISAEFYVFTYCVEFCIYLIVLEFVSWYVVTWCVLG